jgi:predicted NBD/HSP70 family sugar kinase
VDKNGPVCFCGNRGCLEIMCCVETVLQQCSELIENGKCCILNQYLKNSNIALNYLSVLKAFSMGDIDVEKVLRECAEYLGVGLTNIINMFNPDRIIINGDELLTSDFIFETAVKEANMRAYELFTKDLIYEKVNINTEMAVGGIALYVADRLFDIAGPEC